MGAAGFYDDTVGKSPKPRFKVLVTYPERLFSSESGPTVAYEGDDFVSALAEFAYAVDDGRKVRFAARKSES